MAKREKDCGGYVGKALRNAQEREAANAKRRAKRQELTDWERAYAEAWDWARPLDREPKWEDLDERVRDTLRYTLAIEAHYIGIGIRMGRALATPGGKPGKGKGGGR